MSIVTHTINVNMLEGENTKATLIKALKTTAEYLEWENAKPNTDLYYSAPDRYTCAVTLSGPEFAIAVKDTE